MENPGINGVSREALLAWGRARSELTGVTGEVFCLFSGDWEQTFFASSSYESVWGRPCQELYQRPLSWLDGVAVEHRWRLNGEITQNGHQDGPPLDFKGVTILRPDGQSRVVNLLVAPLSQEDGPHKFAFVAQDATQHHQQTMANQSMAIRLEESKTALNVLMNHAEEERRNLVSDLRAGLQRLVMPCLDKLRICHLDDGQMALVTLLEANIKALTSPLGRSPALLMNNFTPRQLEVAQLVREGKSNSEIAGQLNISENAVAFHRQHIRSKLGLKNQKMNLRSFLQGMADN